MYKLKTDYLKDAPLHRSFGQMQKPYKYVTIHDAASSTTAKNLAIYIVYNSPEVSCHYCVDESEIYQTLPLDWTSWNAGDGRGPGNTESISIEITRDMDYKSDAYAKAEENAAILAADLLKRNGLTADALRRHYDWNGKMCPHRMFEAEAGKTTGRTWQQFKNLVASLMAPPKPEPPDKGDDPAIITTVRLEKGTVIHPAPPLVVDYTTNYRITEIKNGYGRLLSGAGWVKLPEG